MYNIPTNSIVCIVSSRPVCSVAAAWIGIVGTIGNYSGTDTGQYT